MMWQNKKWSGCPTHLSVGGSTMRGQHLCATLAANGPNPQPKAKPAPLLTDPLRAATTPQSAPGKAGMPPGPP